MIKENIQASKSRWSAIFLPVQRARIPANMLEQYSMLVFQRTCGKKEDVRARTSVKILLSLNNVNWVKNITFGRTRNKLFNILISLISLFVISTKRPVAILLTIVFTVMGEYIREYHVLPITTSDFLYSLV